MDDVIELTDSEAEDRILTQTSSSGLFGGELLNDDPLSAYLVDGERPLCVVRNKKSGLEVEREAGMETIRPDSDYQALLLVTDLQVVCAIGKNEGDRIERLRLDEVFEARVEHRRFRTNILELETHNGLSWLFRSRGDPEPVATAINDVSQTWLYLEGLLEDVVAALDASEQALDGDNAAVRNVLGEVESNLRTVSQQVRNVNEGVRADIESRAREHVKRLVAIRRELYAIEGAGAHAKALEAWRNRDYDTAVTTYDEAILAYEAALDLDGSTPAEGSTQTNDSTSVGESTRSGESTPTDEQLTRRLDGATGERALLRVWPLIEADSKRRRAIESQTGTAVQRWPQVIESYVGLLELADSPAFDIERDVLRDQMTEIVDRAIEDHYEAGIQQVETGDERARAGEEEQAEQHYTRATAQFEQARDLAANAREEYLDSLETALYTVERRLEGELPAEVEGPPVPPLAESGATDSRGRGRSRATDFGGMPWLTGSSGDDSEALSVIDRIRAQKVSTATATDGPRPLEPGSDGGPLTASESNDAGEGAEEGGESGDERVDESGDERDAIREALRGLDEQAFIEFVASLLDANGWSPTVFSAAGRGSYDIVATRGNPEERHLVWTVHRPDGGEMGATLVRRTAAAREADPQADGATFVTTGSLLPSAQQRADEFDVTVVDCEALVKQVIAADLVEMLDRLQQ